MGNEPDQKHNDSEEGKQIVGPAVPRERGKEEPTPAEPAPEPHEVAQVGTLDSPEEKRKKSNFRPGENALQAVQTTKEDKARKLRISVFPREGGRPYTRDVEPDELGTFELDSEMTYYVTRMSVWEEEGILRAIVNEGNPQTINAFSLVGDDSMNPVALHGIASNNLWVQFAEWSRRKSPWRQAGTWGVLLIGVGIILLMLWNIKTMGNGLENINDSIDGLRSAFGSSSGSGSAANHQNIAPGGS